MQSLADSVLYIFIGVIVNDFQKGYKTIFYQSVNQSINHILDVVSLTYNNLMYILILKTPLSITTIFRCWLCLPSFSESDHSKESLQTTAVWCYCQGGCTIQCRSYLPTVYPAPPPHPPLNPTHTLSWSSC